MGRRADGPPPGERRRGTGEGRARRGGGAGRPRATPSLTRARARERSAPGRSEENTCRGAAGGRPAAVTRRSTRRSNEEMRPGSFARSREIRAASSAGPSCRSARCLVSGALLSFSALRSQARLGGFGSALRERASGARFGSVLARARVARVSRARPPPRALAPSPHPLGSRCRTPPARRSRPRPRRVAAKARTRLARSRRRSSSGAARSRGTSPCSSSSARASAARSSSCRGATVRRPSPPLARRHAPPLFFHPNARPARSPSHPDPHPPSPARHLPRPLAPVADDTPPPNERADAPLHAALARRSEDLARPTTPPPPGEGADADAAAAARNVVESAPALAPPPPPPAPPSRPPSRADEIDVGGARPHRSAPRRPATVPRDCSEPREFVRFHSIDPLGLDAARGSGWFEAARRRRRSSRVVARARSPREPLRVVLSLALDLVRARDDVGRSRPAPPVRGPLEAFSPERPLARVGFGRRRF